MRIIHSDFKKGQAKVLVENLDDLWYLSTIIDINDSVSAVTFRKIKIGGEEDRKANVVKKKAFMTIAVQKVEFHKYSDALRINGLITDGPEDIPRGSYHTLNIEPSMDVTIIKERWLNYQIKRLEESTKELSSNILACAFDREEAHFFRIKRQGYEYISSVKGQVQKKAFEQQSSNFYEEILKTAEELDKRENFSNIIMASPAFYNDELQKNIKGDIGKKIVMATCSDAQKNAIVEIMQRPELKTILQKDQTSREIKLVEELLKNIAKEEKNAYSFAEVKKSVEMGAAEKLLVTDSLIHKMREDDTFEKLEEVMKKTDEAGGDVHIISSDHEGGQKLEGLGGIGAILRY